MSPTLRARRLRWPTSAAGHACTRHSSVRTGTGWTSFGKWRRDQVRAPSRSRNVERYGLALNNSGLRKCVNECLSGADGLVRVRAKLFNLIVLLLTEPEPVRPMLDDVVEHRDQDQGEYR